MQSTLAPQPTRSPSLTLHLPNIVSRPSPAWDSSSPIHTPAASEYVPVLHWVHADAPVAPHRWSAPSPCTSCTPRARKGTEQQAHYKQRRTHTRPPLSHQGAVLPRDWSVAKPEELILPGPAHIHPSFSQIHGRKSACNPFMHWWATWLCNL